MEEAYKQGIVVQSKSGGVPALKRYLDEQEGTPLDDCWTDIGNVQSGKEAIGYPTQKPFALMKRIIEMASNEGDIVLDPFVGGGTTVAVADKLNRRWIPKRAGSKSNRVQAKQPAGFVQQTLYHTAS